MGLLEKFQWLLHADPSPKANLLCKPRKCIILQGMYEIHFWKIPKIWHLDLAKKFYSGTLLYFFLFRKTLLKITEQGSDIKLWKISLWRSQLATFGHSLHLIRKALAKWFWIALSLILTNSSLLYKKSQCIYLVSIRADLFWILYFV